ncbi:unnamed protein product [Leptidea sinapis]|uniref:Catenin alpha n=1 Tax=Leptidea sinapis TaxID=189913 RepID=A0A5E4Q8Z9_9NEOP|nr:unnamed protein product [Leptidea sinapis]
MVIGASDIMGNIRADHGIPSRFGGYTVIQPSPATSSQTLEMMSKFAVRVDAAVSALGAGGNAGLDENDFIDASRLVYDAVREIRRAVLMNRDEDDLDPEDVELDEQYTLETRSKSSAHTGEHGVDEYPDISGITNARRAWSSEDDHGCHQRREEDLRSWHQRIALYCHQIQITSKVKADVQNISGELILDSATSLIQAAKNLMNAVVLTVKASYVASTKYTRQGTIASPIVVWRMKAPEKKPLIRPEKPEEVRAKVRRGSQKKQPSPVHALAEFQSPADTV